MRKKTDIPYFLGNRYNKADMPLIYKNAVFSVTLTLITPLFGKRGILSCNCGYFVTSQVNLFQ